MSIVKSIRIQNFKSLEDVTIDLSQLTFLFGANSSGKSSFLKALMFLAQNYDIDKAGKVLYNISNHLNLDEFESTVINHDISRNIKIELTIECTLKVANINTDLISKTLKNNLDLYSGIPAHEYHDFKKYEIETIDKKFNCSLNFEVSGQADPVFGKGIGEITIIDRGTGFSYKKANWGTKFDFVEKDFEQLFKEKWEYKSFRASEILSSEYNTLYCYSEDWEKLSAEEKIMKMYKMLEFGCLYEQIDSEIRKFLNYKHLGVTREIPKSEMIMRNPDNLDDKYYGFLRLLFDMIPYEAKFKPDDLEDRSIFDMDLNRFEERRFMKIDGTLASVVTTNPVKKVVQFWEFINLQLLKFEFGLIYRIFQNDIVFNFKLQDKDGKLISFQNASSGLTQLLPVFIACSILRESYFEGQKRKLLTADLYKKYQSMFFTLLLEQPELHLHPKLQSKLAVLFAETVNNTHDDFSLIIETHSEHLIRKIQVLIAKGELKRNKVKVYFFNKENGITQKPIEMKFDKYGLFKQDWPKNFFDDSIQLSLDLFEAIKMRKN